MAIPSWLTISPVSGTGDGNLTIKAEAHTGRLARSYAATIKTTTGSPAKTATLNIQQAAKPEFVSVDPLDIIPANTLASYAVTGKSNGTRLTIITDPNADAVLKGITPKSYNVNGKSYTGTTAIEGDPGATAEYIWSMNFTLPTNTSLNQQTYTFAVKSTGSDPVTVTIRQAGIAPTLSLGASSASLPQAGGTTTISVTSNASWSVS